MFSRASTRAPWSLVALVAAVTIVPLATLLWVGWRLLEQDRLLERQQIAQRVDRAADLVVAALQRALATDEQRLAAGVREWPEGAVVVRFQDGHVSASPGGRVAYFPAVTPLPEKPAEAFAHGEDLEFRRRDLTTAINVYRQLAQSADRPLRAGALFRLARTLQKSNRLEEALQAYASLTEMDDAGIGQVPAGLAAMYARGKLLERMQRTGELQALGADFDHHLRSGRWELTGAVYLLYAADAATWSGKQPGSAPSTEVLAEAIGALWNKWKTSPLPSDSSGRESFEGPDAPLTVLWRTASDSTEALLLSSAYVESNWLAPAQVVAAEQHVTFALYDLKGLALNDRVLRNAAESALPWPLAAASLQPPVERSEFAQRRRFLTTGFAVLVFLALAASYLIFRSVARELAVARLQSDFVAAVSHEFRTPLTTLRQFTDMLRERSTLDRQQRELAYDVQSRATERLTRLVESLLDFGRMEAGVRRYQLEPRDCTDLVGSVVSEFRGETQATGHDVTFQGDPSVVSEADDEALARAVRNLLDNAVKYSPTPSTVVVRLERDNGHVRISVRDSGIGIPPSERATIFAKFHRGEQARHLGIKGTGIGLAMVDEIVRAHGGHVEVESVIGKGSTFTIVLPATARQSQPAAGDVELRV